MIRSLTKGLFAVLMVGTAAAAGCATSFEPLGGEGGDGGSDDTASGSGGAPASVCTTDCSMLPAPPCQIGACNEMTAVCEIVPDEGAPCDDGLFCTVGEVCKGGACGGGSANPCNEIPSDGCSGALCDEEQKACTPQLLPDGTSCMVEDLCTVNATCKAGVCSGAQKDCFFAPAPDECHNTACNPANGQCDPVPGNDGAACVSKVDLCSIQTVCLGGACQGGVPKCDYLSGTCTNGICDDATGDCSIEPINDGMACNDGNSCTDADTCAAGACEGVPSVDYEVYFSDTFANNAAGWTIGTEWGIGPAMASPGGGTFGFYEDPSLDHTATADNGVAGVVIGGYAGTGLHPMYYLESPPFDASSMGEVHLQFWRHLNSDYTSFMNNVIEIYNGAQWSQIWQSGGSSTQDSAWTYITHDITQFKSANMRVRFGFDVGSSGVYIVSSWNIDDVVIANKACQ